MASSILPHVNAALNASSAVLLVSGWICIARRRVVAHQFCMAAACVVSLVFLISYIAYHVQVGSVRFQGQGWIRPVYFTILISHTVLAVAIVPFVVRTLWFAAHRQFERHRALGRLTLPVWLYVSVTGVVVYLMLYHLR
jgi:uncharacterized membrane protein YozB (DUF420 family)